MQSFKCIYTPLWIQIFAVYFRVSNKCVVWINILYRKFWKINKCVGRNKHVGNLNKHVGWNKQVNIVLHKGVSKYSVGKLM